jgi:hypothetical protein
MESKNAPNARNRKGEGACLDKNSILRLAKISHDERALRRFSF